MFKKIIKFKAVSILSLISTLFVLGGAIWAYFALRPASAGPLILHFDDIEGITSVGPLANIVFVAVLGFITVIINSLVALEFESRDRFLGKLLAVVTLIFAILLFIGFAAIVNVN